jgi:antitoxin component YwqK of YwqJK toxin-antitoxin module
MMYHLLHNKKQSVITGYKRQYYLNGQLQNYVYRDREGRRQGKSMSYYESGNPWTECFYLNDIYNGTYRSFHPSGKIEAEMGFEKGKAEGVYKRYDEDGNLTVEYWNRNGKRHGTYRYWINGWIKTLATYKNGRCVFQEFR